MRRSVVPAVLPILVIAVAVLSGPRPAMAQEEGALYKSDVVRLLTGRAQTQEEIAALVRRRCLGFEPTERDLRNFRMLGAGATVLEAIRDCADPAGGRSAPPPAPPPRAPVEGPGSSEDPDPAPSAGPDPVPGRRAETELTLFVSPRRARAGPGEEVEVTAEVTAGAVPVGQVALAVRAPTGAGEADLFTVVRTDAGGRARFRLPAAPSGIRRYEVEGLAGEIQGAGEVVVETVAPDDRNVSPEDRTADRTSGAGAPAGAGGEASGGDRNREAGSPEIASSLLADPGRALEEAAGLSRRGQYGEADRLYRAILRRYPESVEARVGYAYHLARTGEHAEAEERLREISPEEEDRADVQKVRGFLSLWTEEPEEAARRFRRATELAPDDPEAWRGLGSALSELGREEEARDAFRRVRELGRRDRPRDAGSGGRDRPPDTG